MAQPTIPYRYRIGTMPLDATPFPTTPLDAVKY